jgi:uncharacterized damage-inducible protein DinB
MAESFAEYVRRIEREVEGRDRRRVLSSTPAVLARKIRLGPGRRLLRPPAKTKWSVAEILAHLCDTELLWGYRIRKILEKEGSAVPGIDQDRWAAVLKYRRFELAESLELFRVLRRRNLAILASLSPRDLRKWGRHSQFGRLSIDRIITLMAGHDVNHSRQIDAILKERGRGKS